MVSLAAVETVLARLPKTAGESRTAEVSDDLEGRTDMLMRLWRPAHLDEPLQLSGARADDEAMPTQLKGRSSSSTAGGHLHHASIQSPRQKLGEQSDRPSTISYGGSSSSFQAARPRSADRSEVSTVASPSAVRAGAISNSRLTTAAVNVLSQAPEPSWWDRRISQEGAVTRGAATSPQPLAGPGLHLHGPADWMPSEARAPIPYARQKLLGTAKPSLGRSRCQPQVALGGTCKPRRSELAVNGRHFG
mmetsp:Transcript_20627/g.37132  ORF Transcript_20627/g.37132 Transcript_20627/m.37132 type:complete len:248 (-) Transcript_20627:117-860(-)